MRFRVNPEQGLFASPCYPQSNNFFSLKSTRRYFGFFNFYSTFFHTTHPNTQFPSPFLCLVLDPVATEAQWVTLFKKRRSDMMPKDPSNSGRPDLLAAC